MRELNISRLELYVRNYLAQKPPRTGQGLNFLRKAKAYIDYAVEYRKCDFDEKILPLYTVQDNQFTRTVYNMITNLGLDYFRRSLQKTSQMLETYINR